MKDSVKKDIFYFCTRCCQAAGVSCITHRYQIMKYYGTEINDLPKRKRFQCRKCFKISFSSDLIHQCEFCQSKTTFNC